jgi:hypothetical protein
MPPQRTPLHNIDGNRRYRCPELTPYQSGLVVGQRLAGKSPHQIEVDLELSRGVVRRTLDSIQLRDEGHSLPRSGPKLKYDSRSRRRMILCLRNHPKLTYAQRREHTGLKMSNSYIYNLATSEGMTHWRAKKRPELTEAHAAA